MFLLIPIILILVIISGIEIWRKVHDKKEPSGITIYPEHWFPSPDDSPPKVNDCWGYEACSDVSTVPDISPFSEEKYQ